MFLTNILFKKAKSKHIMVLMESMVSGHKFISIRERLADKLELLRFDPYKAATCPKKLDTPVFVWVNIRAFEPPSLFQQLVHEMLTKVRQQSLYKERKKIRSIKSS